MISSLGSLWYILDIIMMTERIAKREEENVFYHWFCNSFALQPHEDDLLNLPLPQCSHLWKGNSVISACSLVTERMCQWLQSVSKTPQAVENKSSIQMFVRLSLTNKEIPITEDIISGSTLKKARPPDTERQMHSWGLRNPGTQKWSHDLVWRGAAPQAAPR